MPVSSHNQPAMALLLEYFRSVAEDHILILEGGDGWLASQVARLAAKGKVINHDRDIRKIEIARQRLVSFKNASSESRAIPNRKGYDQVLLVIPKERSYSKKLLIASYQSLKVGGQLLLAGPSRKGAKSVIKDAQELFGNGTLLGYRSHQRVARCEKQGELPDPLPAGFQASGIAPGTSYFLEVKSPSGNLTLQTCPGIFSWERVDIGTSMLLEHLIVKPGSTVWDVGCGYGVLGLIAGKGGAAKVLMSDMNTLATEYAQINAAENQLQEKTLVFPSADLTLPEVPLAIRKFDLILSNPAFHQGRSITRSMAEKMIHAAPAFLKPGGRLLLVANLFLNYDKTMQKIFKQVVKIAENNHFHVIEGRI